MASSLSAFDLSKAPVDVITLLLEHMDLQQRFTCALVCSEWAKAAAAATKSVVLHEVRDFTQLQMWLDKNGSQVHRLQLHECTFTLASLPCAQLQDLLLHGLDHGELVLDSRVWSQIAAATKLTSLCLDDVSTSSQEADVVSALTALLHLQKLTCRHVVFVDILGLSDSRLLQHLTRLTYLELHCVAAEALQHLSSLTKLQRLSTHSPPAWAAADYPGLQELQGLTSLELQHPQAQAWGDHIFPACVSHLTALQQLGVQWASFTELNGLTALAALTKMKVANLSPTSTSTLLRLSTLHHLILGGDNYGVGRLPLRMSSLASCMQLRYLSLFTVCLTGPGSLVASSMLQELDIQFCSISSGEDGAAAMTPWELLFPGPGRLPHLKSLMLRFVSPEPQQADFERLVACCSMLQSLNLAYPDGMEEIVTVLPLLPFPHLTQLELSSLTDEQCSTLTQLTGLRELFVFEPLDLSATGLRHLARLEQLTSLKFATEFDSRKVSTVLLEQLSDGGWEYCHAIVHKAPAGCPPDVSARLLRACDMAVAGSQQQH